MLCIGVNRIKIHFDTSQLCCGVVHYIFIAFSKLSDITGILDYLPTSSQKGDMVLSENSHMITSPVMGIFYRSSAPEEKSYVEVGKKVNASDVVCLIESMKVFTKLRADKDGTVKEIFVENEETVMKNQDLIEIEIG